MVIFSLLEQNGWFNCQSKLKMSQKFKNICPWKLGRVFFIGSTEMSICQFIYRLFLLTYHHLQSKGKVNAMRPCIAVDDMFFIFRRYTKWQLFLLIQLLSMLLLVYECHKWCMLPRMRHWRYIDFVHARFLSIIEILGF